PDDHRGPSSDMALDVETTPVALDDPVSNREAEADPGRTRREVRVEHVGQDGLGDPGSRILDGNLRPVAVLSRRYHENAPVRHGLERVDDHVEEDLGELALVAGDARELWIELGLDSDAVVRGFERDQAE